MFDSRSSRRFSPVWTFGLPIALLIIVLSLSAGSASAQSVDIPAVMNPDLKAPPTAVAVQFGHQFETDIESPGAEIARTNALLSIAHRIKLSEKSSLFTLGTYTLHGYDFSGGASPYQWDDVHRVVIGALVGYDINERWRLIGGGIVRSWGESGADYGDSITAGAILGFDYHPSETYSVGALFGIFSVLEDRLAFMPVPTLKWQFAEKWRWNVGLVTALDPGVGTELTWMISEDFALGTGISFQNRRYRLADKTRVSPPVAGRSDDGGIGQETSVPLFATLRWRPTPKSSIDILGGVAFAGNVRVESDDGGRIKDDDYDPAPFLGVKGTIAF